MDPGLNIAEWTSVATLVGGAGAFVVGLWQYRRAQLWKRSEWVAQEMKALLDQPSVRAALLMIDWSDRRIPLVDPVSGALETARVTDEIVSLALRPHVGVENYPPPQPRIRDAFDALLDGLGRIATYVDAGLVDVEDLHPYLEYWVRRLHGERAGGSARANATAVSGEPPPRVEAIHAYMQFYGYERVAQLLCRLHGCCRGVGKCVYCDPPGVQ